MINQLKEKLSEYGFDLDPYYSFFLHFELEKALENKVLFEKEGLDFNFSNVTIPWSKLEKNLAFSGIEKPTKSTFFEKFNIDSACDSIVFEEIYSLEKMIQLFDPAFIHDPKFKDGFIQIAVVEEPIHSRLLYSLRELDFGSVWLELPEESFITKLSQNIILLLSKASVSVQDASINRFGGSLDKIYKNWGEDFWRVKE